MHMKTNIEQRDHKIIVDYFTILELQYSKSTSKALETKQE